MISSGLSHIREINKEIQVSEYFVSFALFEKEKRLRKSIRRRKGKVSKLLPIYENAAYFDEE